MSTKQKQVTQLKDASDLTRSRVFSSQSIVVGFASRIDKPTSSKKRRKYTVSFAASVKAMYLASVLDRATVRYFLDSHDTAKL